MKTMTCDLCNHAEQADTFEQWMDKMKPHYMAGHMDFMMQQALKSKAEQMQEMQTWMQKNQARFDAA